MISQLSDFYNLLMQQSSSPGFRESKAKSVQEGEQEQLTNINRNICMSRTPHTLRNMRPRGLIKVTSTKNKPEKPYYLTKLR